MPAGLTPSPHPPVAHARAPEAHGRRVVAHSIGRTAAEQTPRHTQSELEQGGWESEIRRARCAHFGANRTYTDTFTRTKFTRVQISSTGEIAPDPFLPPVAALF